jgi:Cys-rich protein (TIGR01571 family)
MDRYESIETLAVKLNQPKLYTMSSKGITTEDIAQMKCNQAQAYGFTTEEYGTLKTYLKNHNMKNEPSAISTSPFSAGGKMNQISNQNTAPSPIYAAQHPMSVPKQMAQVSPEIIGTRELPGNKWSKDLFDCSHHLGFCLLSCLCPCVGFGVLYQKAASTDDPNSGWLGTCGMCATYLLTIVLGPSHCTISGAFRTALREGFNIPGDDCTDYCLHCFCPSCAMTQELYEMEYRSTLGQ